MCTNSHVADADADADADVSSQKGGRHDSVEWNGEMEWNSRMEWNGTVGCHAHQNTHAYSFNLCSLVLVIRELRACVNPFASCQAQC